MKTAYIIYNYDADIIGVALSQAEALHQIWRLCMQDPEFSTTEILEENGYDILEELEEDWKAGALGDELWQYYYEENQIFNSLGLE